MSQRSVLILGNARYSGGPWWLRNVCRTAQSVSRRAGLARRGLLPARCLGRHASILGRRWKGVERINIEVARTGPQATLEFDWHSIRDAARRESVCLVLGYNSAIFLPYLRLMGRTVVTNMDGLEWRRQKWNRAGTRLVLGQRVDRGLDLASPDRRSPGDRRSPRHAAVAKSHLDDHLWGCADRIARASRH